MGEDIWYQAVDHGYKHDAFVACSVLNLFTKDGKIKEAKAVFEGIKKSLFVELQC
jgi:pentatricopeptide repeat protein